jgi:hypothetical protein
VPAQCAELLAAGVELRPACAAQRVFGAVSLDSCCATPLRRPPLRRSAATSTC